MEQKLPWKADGSGIYIDSPDGTIRYIATTSSYGKGHAARAEFIVKSANAHQGLVDAIKGLIRLDLIDYDAPPCQSPELELAIKNAKAALKTCDAL